MSSHFRFRLTVLFLTLALLVPKPLPAQDHVVSRADLHQALQAATKARQADLAKIEKFFSSEPGAQALKTAKVDYAKIEKAMPLLTDEELARIASHADRIQNDFAAGALTNQEITYIIIALATAVLILVIVAAR